MSLDGCCIGKLCSWDLAFVGNYNNFSWGNMCHDLDLLRAGLVCLKTGYTHFLEVTHFDGMSPERIKNK